MDKLKNHKSEKVINIKSILLAIVAITLVIFLYFIFVKFSDNTKQNVLDTIDFPVVINEIMTNNASYPDERGIICDWAEFYNSSSEDINIGGFIIYDKQREKSLVLPQDTIIKRDGYLLISFGGNNGDFVAPFALSKEGKETLILCDANDNIIDLVSIDKLRADSVMARDIYGNWEVSERATPLYSNDYNEYDAFIKSMESANDCLLITEVMSNNDGRILDRLGRYSDWFEVTNISDSDIKLSQYFISDEKVKPYKYRLPDKIITPGESIIIFATGNDAGDLDEEYADFKISASGESLYLHNWRGILCDYVEIPIMPENYSYSRADSGDFYITKKQTPGKSNDYVSLSLDDYQDLFISEVCPSNASGILDSDGDWSDWIELKNQGDSNISLDNIWITVDSADAYQFKLPDVTIKSQECLIIYASNKDKSNDEIHTNFALSSYGQTISLYTNDGYLIDLFDYPKANDDMSFSRLNKAETVILSDYSTPGYDNSFEGYLKYMQQMTFDSPLIINEVMTSNSKYLPVEFGENYDWIELINISDTPLNLSDYKISDDLDFPNLCLLPNVTLQPSEKYLVICSGDASKTNKYFHADFALSSEYTPLYLFDKNDNPIDWMTLKNIPPDTSFGRMAGKNGFYHFATPTPGTINKDGLNGVSKEPTPSLSGGIYTTSEDKLTIELNSTGDIYYTLNGSVPNTSSLRYLSPIEISDSTSIRAITIEPDMMISKVSTNSYFLNVSHDLPILSLSVNPRDMFDEKSGIYVEGITELGNYFYDWEKAANLTFYDIEGGGFSIDCGLKMHGGGSRESNTKKSLKVIFRPKYGQDNISYDLFGENTPSTFTSLVIRSGEDYRYTLFLSELITGLAKDANPRALTQAHKYCVLYVNGEYFGIFSLMERYNQEYYAARYDVTPESVRVVEAADIAKSGFYDLLRFCSSNDMRLKENYDYICDNVDIDILIDWCIFQAYSSNSDIPYNARIISSTEGDMKWRYCFYDLDWTMRDKTPTFDIIFNRGYYIFELPMKLIINEEFQQQLLSRANELRSGVLSNENVLAKIEEYDKLLSTEMPSDKKRWNLSMTTYDTRLELLKEMVRDIDRWDALIESLSRYILTT